MSVNDSKCWYGCSSLDWYWKCIQLHKSQGSVHNLKFICPIIATPKINCYATPSRIFIVGEGEILYSERTTQGDPTAMRAYTLGTLPFLLEFINLNNINAKKAVFSDNFFAAGSLNSI